MQPGNKWFGFGSQKERTKYHISFDKGRSCFQQKADTFWNDVSADLRTEKAQDAPVGKVSSLTAISSCGLAGVLQDTREH